LIALVMLGVVVLVCIILAMGFARHVAPKRECDTTSMPSPDPENKILGFAPENYEWVNNSSKRCLQQANDTRRHHHPP
jgi:hypothetical protein